MINEIINKFKQFSKQEIYKWLLVSIIYPSNQRYIIRYELLIHTLLSINDKDFFNNQLNESKFKNFIEWFEEKYSHYFIMMEDWEPFEQTQLIPIFFENKKYNFYYGALERPYEAIKHFQQILFTEKIIELESTKIEFLLSLEIQTKVLALIIDDPEAKIKNNQMYVPTLKSTNRYFDIFKVNTINKDYLHNFKSKYEMGINNFNGIYTEINNEFFILPPQCHIETLYQITEPYLYSGDVSTLLPKINNTFLNRSKKMISQFFGIRQMLDILLEPIMKSNLAEYFNSIVRVDANKVLLFKNINHSDVDLAYKINKEAKQSVVELKKIKDNSWIGLKHLDDKIENTNIVPLEILEFKIILIYEKLTLNYMLSFTENWKEKDIFIFNSMDIKPIFELLEEKETISDISFIKYLEAQKKQSIQNKNKLIQIDALDSFAYYYKNESFLIAGEQPTFMMFDTHQWSSFYNQYLYTKYKDNIYELIELNYPNKFNHIKHINNSIYEYIDTSFLDAGRCIKYNNRLIWIVYPNGLSSNKEEFDTFIFLGDFLSWYIDRYKDKLFQLFKKYGFDINTQDFMIVIYPEKFIKRYKELSHFIPYTKQLTTNKSIVFNTQIRKIVYNEIFMALVCRSSLEELQDIFKEQHNKNPEKEILKDFIISVLDCLKVENKEIIAQSFIDTNWDLNKRAFTVQEKFTSNPKLGKYKQPHKFQDSIIANVNQEIVTFLKELGSISPQEYWGEDAKNLNNLIFGFLQKKLEDEINKFNFSLLFYAYTQVEYIEGKRENDNTQMQLDTSRHIEFDIQERYNKQRLEISNLATSVKHIVHSIIKVNPCGYKAVVNSDWYYLMALATIINETIQISDQLQYKLSDTGIEITEIYEFRDIDKTSKIDFEAYHEGTTSSKIISSKNKPLSINSFSKNHTPKNVPIFDKNLNNSWMNSYGFYLDDMLGVMTNITIHNFEDEKNFPLVLLSIEEIYSHIENNLLDPPSKEEISKIVEFLSLSCNTYKDFKYLDYSLDRLMKKKERLTLSPFIKLDDKYLFGHQTLLLSTVGWHQALIRGDIPFTIDEKCQIKKDLEVIHQKLDKDLENFAYEEAVKSLGEKYVRKTINKFQTISKTFPQRPKCGEIDLLVVNQKSKTIYVIDAKNVSKKLTTSSMDRELNKFVKGKKSYLIKLTLKSNFISDNIDEVLNHFNIIDKENWKVQKAFVVNTLYVSAFYKDAVVDFVLLDNLTDYITQGEQ